MGGLPYSIRTPVRPRLAERLALTACKLLAEFSVAALAIVLWIPFEALGLEAPLGVLDAFTFVVIYAVVFGYLPLAFVLASLWGFFPRTWRPIFPYALTLLGAGLLTVGHVLFGAPISLAPLVIGMIVTGIAVLVVYRLLYWHPYDP